jgi:hypothetical protein
VRRQLGKEAAEFEWRAPGLVRYDPRTRAARQLVRAPTND